MTAGDPLPIDQLREFCLRHRIAELSLFGSILRPDFTAASDVDVMVDFEPGVTLDADDYERIEADLRAIFGRDVDLVNKRYLRNPFIRHEIFNNRRIVYAA